MSKTDLLKLNRELNDLEEVKDDGTTSVAKFYKDKIKKRGINTEAFKLFHKLNGLDNSAKQQAFLRDFDQLRKLAGWDNQKNLFEADKTAPQKADEKAAKAPAVPKAAAKAAAESAKLGAKANAATNKRTERAAAKAAPSRAALFDENSDGDDAPRH